jgi:biotin transporter BioY
VVIEVLMVVGVVLVPLPALAIGSTRLLDRSGRATDQRTDRVELVLVVLGRLIGLLLLVALSGITLLSCIGALVQNVPLHSLVYVFFVADLLVAILVLLTVGRLDRRPRRRSASPARR